MNITSFAKGKLSDMDAKKESASRMLSKLQTIRKIWVFNQKIFSCFSLKQRD